MSDTAYRVKAKKPPGPTRGQAHDAAEDLLSRFHEEDDVKNVYDLRTVRRLWPFLRPQARWVVLSIALLCINSALALCRPLLMKAGLDAIDGPNGAARLTEAGIALTAVIVLEQCLAFPQMYVMQLAGARAMAAMRRHVFSFLHRRSLAYFDRTPVGRLVTRVTNDIDAIQEMFSSGALNAIGDLIRLVVIVVIMLSLDWKMSLIAFVALPPVAFGVNWVRPRLRRAYRVVRAKTARMNAYINEQVSGMVVVQAYARETAAQREFDDINRAYRNANNSSIAYDASLDAAIEMISSVCIASVLWFAAVRDSGTGVTFGTLFAFVAYIDMFFLPIRDLSQRYSLVQSALTGAERVFDLLDNEEEDAPARPSADRSSPDDEPQGGDGAEPGPEMSLSHVTFAYKPTTPVLFDVSLKAMPGERIALVGATGAGKSTVASLLLRLYDVREGCVRVRGRDVRDYDREALRAHFAAVPQDVFLFPGTLLSNIAAGDEEPELERARSALERIGALDLFEGREGGLDAPVLERGSNFSAGERQLIAFARAMYRDPPILILDEATANVDSDTEARLQRAVEQSMQGRTSLIIAHRLSTIRAADRIIVFHKGRVVEEGKHETLLEARGVYARLYQLQFSDAVPFGQSR